MKIKISFLAAVIILFLAQSSLAQFPISRALDIEGEGYLWIGNDIGQNHDRAGGTGNWTYGTMANGEKGLLSLYQFEGLGGFYSVFNEGNIFQNIYGTDLEFFNASVKMDNETVDVKLNGTGRIKMVIGASNEKGQPADLSRTYISGKFEIGEKHNVGAW